MEEWRRCVSYLELAEKQWRERLLPANNAKNILTQYDIYLVNGEIQDIRQFMQEQPWSSDNNTNVDALTLLELRKRIQNLNIALFSLSIQLRECIVFPFDRSLEE